MEVEIVELVCGRRAAGAVGVRRGEAVSEVRPIFVVDGDGELVGTFTDWQAGHDWAHARAAEAGARLPVRVEDPRYRRTTEIDHTGCYLIRWRRMSRRELCGPP